MPRRRLLLSSSLCPVARLCRMRWVGFGRSGTGNRCTYCAGRRGVDGAVDVGAARCEGACAEDGVYTRSAFGAAWTDANTVLWGGNSLSAREDMPSRDRVNITCKVRSSAAAASPPGVVRTGGLHDPYIGTTLNFVRRETTSPLVPIEHVVTSTRAKSPVMVAAALAQKCPDGMCADWTECVVTRSARPVSYVREVGPG